MNNVYCVSRAFKPSRDCDSDEAGEQHRPYPRGEGWKGKIVGWKSATAVSVRNEGRK